MKLKIIASIFIIHLMMSFTASENKEKTMNGFDVSNASVDLEWVEVGGPQQGEIHSIDNPKFVAGAESKLLKTERVLGIVHNGIVKAYPIYVMEHHEIVNDHFGDKAVTVTYCPACMSGIAYDAHVDDKNLSFGVSGLTYFGDVLLFDQQTNSLWCQVSSASISGPMQGTELEIISAQNTTWDAWFADHPETEVMTRETGFNIDYAKGMYPGYDEAKDYHLEHGPTSDLYEEKEWILGVEVNGVFKAYPFSELKKVEKEVIYDKVNGTEIKIYYFDDSKSAYAQYIDQEQNEDVKYMTIYWFAWYAFHPDGEVYKVE